MRPLDLEALYNRTKELLKLTGERNVTISALQQKLAISFLPAKKIWQRLVDEGLIENKRAYIRRATTRPKTSTSQGRASAELPEDLYPEVKAFVIRKQYASKPFLGKQFHLSDIRTRKMFERLKADGIIATRGRRTIVLVPSDSAPVQAAMPALVAEHAARPNQPASARNSLVATPTTYPAEVVGSLPLLPDISQRWRLSLLISILGKDAARTLLHEAVQDLAALDQLIG